MYHGDLCIQGYLYVNLRFLWLPPYIAQRRAPFYSLEAEVCALFSLFCFVLIIKPLEHFFITGTTGAHNDILNLSRIMGMC